MFIVLFLECLSSSPLFSSWALPAASGAGLVASENSAAATADARAMAERGSWLLAIDATNKADTSCSFACLPLTATKSAIATGMHRSAMMYHHPVPRLLDRTSMTDIIAPTMRVRTPMTIQLDGWPGNVLRRGLDVSRPPPGASCLAWGGRRPPSAGRASLSSLAAALRRCIVGCNL